MRTFRVDWIAVFIAATCTSARAQNWCTTTERWQAKAGQAQPVGGNCPLLGDCDSPPVRDGFIPNGKTPLIEMRLHLVVFREDNGQNPAATEAEVIGQMVQLNEDFAPWGITFTYTWQYIDNSLYRYGDGDDSTMKAFYSVSPEIQCNVFVLGTGGTSYGNFPWDPDAITAQGGIVMHDGAFGIGASVLTHEVGHNLGLWHTHHGVSEVPPCSSCWEGADGVNADSTGDRCSDTPPTPVNFNCSDPGGTDQCSGTPWGNTLVEDYMSYGGTTCWDQFTDQQGGRMHCWIDRVLWPWTACGLTGGFETLNHAAGADDNFGNALAASGSRAVAGIDGDDLNGPEAGAAAIYTHNGANWIGPLEIRPTDGAAGDEFGLAVAIDGDVALIGAPADDGAGSAYLFRFDGANWVQEQKLPGDGDAGDDFGTSVALSGTVAVVGAPFDDEAATDAGAAFVYRYDGASWVLEQKLMAGDAAELDRFGFSAAISGDAALIGARFDDNGTPSTGSAYMFRFDGASWPQEQKLIAGGGIHGDLYGHSVDIDGDVAVVGAYRYDVGALNTGSAFVYRYNGASWVQEDQVSGSVANEQLGFSVDIDGDRLLAGTPQDHANGQSAGAANVYGFDGSSWQLEGILLATDGAAGDKLGTAVAISDAGLLAGAPFTDGAATDAGSIYAFNFDCNDNGVPDGCEIADGKSLDDNANGIPDECEVTSCPWDIDGNGSVSTADLLTLLGAWGPNPGHPADFDASGIVATGDLLALLANWGSCP